MNGALAIDPVAWVGSGGSDTDRHCPVQCQASFVSLKKYIYRLPPLPPTSKTRVTEELMLGAPCCFRWVPFGLDGR